MDEMDDDVNSIDSTMSFIDELRTKTVDQLLVDYTTCIDAEKHLGDYKVVLKEKFGEFCRDYNDFTARQENILEDICKFRFPDYEAKVEQHFIKFPKVWFLTAFFSHIIHLALQIVTEFASKKKRFRLSTKA